jgi:hypothetical protein
MIHKQYAMLTPLELHVDMIMTQLDRVLAVDMTTVRDARVGHIISTL